MRRWCGSWWVVVVAAGAAAAAAAAAAAVVVVGAAAAAAAVVGRWRGKWWVVGAPRTSRTFVRTSTTRNLTLGYRLLGKWTGSGTPAPFAGVLPALPHPPNSSLLLEWEDSPDWNGCVNN